MAINILYDGECPFCSNYVSLLRLRGAAGPVTLTDLRQDAAARERMIALGADPDLGMAVETEGRFFHGAEAMTALSLLSSKAGALNRLAAGVFRHRHLTTLLYPILRAGRNATLFLLGRRPIGAPDPGERALFEIFSRVLGLFTLLHAAYFYLISSTGPHVTTLPLFLLGCGMVVLPRERRLFVATVVMLAADGLLQAPVYSNHTILTNFLILTMIVAGLWHMLRGTGWDSFFRSVRPVGRFFLLTMYGFGIFHKINTDFLDPAVSCAVALWRRMPEPLNWLDNEPMHYLAIYGTFIVEGAIMLMLLRARWRHLGIASGIGFHAMLALSGYALYSPFSTLAIALHTLFLAPSSALRITSRAAYDQFDRIVRSPIGVGAFAALLGAFWLAVAEREFLIATIVWLFLIACPAAIILLWGHARGEPSERNFLWSPVVGLNLISGLFFLNCAAPFLGLKTAQSMNMFANIRVEGGISNHLVFPNPPRPFRYLDDVVVITGAKGSRRLERLAQQPDRGLVYYEFLSILESSPDATVSFTRNGKAFADVTAADLLARDGGMLHSRWVRKFFHFKPVSLDRPVRCSWA